MIENSRDVPFRQHPDVLLQLHARLRQGQHVAVQQVSPILRSRIAPLDAVATLPLQCRGL
ncbi:hypothetical protein PG990_014392 [Apiospora arundinis]